MNSLLNLGRCLGDVPTASFQRYYLNQLVLSLEHCHGISFTYETRSDQLAAGETNRPSDEHQNAHKSGTNCLHIEAQTSQYLFTGGADSTIRMWDLEQHAQNQEMQPGFKYTPTSALLRSHRMAHTHALTSISVYPFDASPATLLSTSYDKSFLLSAITPSSLQPVHKSSLDFTPHTHAISPHPSSSPLVAIGTTHPAIRLFDLRTGLSTHSLPGHNGAVYALAFHTSTQHAHVLMSGAVDGRILLFDIRRANPAFASLDLDDAIGFPSSSFADPAEARASDLHLNFNARAHTGPVTGLAPTASGERLISAGHDGRIRLWDLSTGRNDLVHFGPRIRNSRNANLTPLLLPDTCGKPGRELLAWPNDDGRGEIFLHHLREGTMLQVFRTHGVDRSNALKKGSASQKLTNRGRINQLALRFGKDTVAGGHGIEMYSAHGDGSVCVWRPSQEQQQDAEIEKETTEPRTREEDDKQDFTVTDTSRSQASMESQRKRKRDLIGDLVQGLTKKQITFS